MTASAPRKKAVESDEKRSCPAVSQICRVMESGAEGVRGGGGASSSAASDGSDVVALRDACSNCGLEWYGSVLVMKSVPIVAR